MERFKRACNVNKHLLKKKKKKKKKRNDTIN